MLKDYKSYMNRLNEAEVTEKPVVVDTNDISGDNDDMGSVITSISDKIKKKYQDIKTKATKLSNFKTNDGTDLMDGDSVIDQEVYIMGKFISGEHDDSGEQSFKIKLSEFIKEDKNYTFELLSSELNRDEIEFFRHDGDELPQDRTMGKYILKNKEERDGVLNKKKKENTDKKCAKLNGKEICAGKEYYTYTKHGGEYIIAVIGVTKIDEKKDIIYFEPQKSYKIDENGNFIENNDIDAKTIKYLGKTGNDINTKSEYISKDKEEIVDMIKHHKDSNPDVQDNETDYSQTEGMTDKDINKFISELDTKVTNQDKDYTSKNFYGDVSVIFNYLLKSNIDKKNKLVLLGYIKDLINSASKQFSNDENISTILNQYTQVENKINKSND